MNIGLDIDGVLINQEKFQLKYGTKHFKKKYIEKYKKEHGIKLKSSDVQVLDISTGKGLNGKEVDLNSHYITIDANGYGIKEVFDCSEEEETKFWYKYMIPYALFAPFRKDAVRVIKELRSEGNKIVASTARAKSNENTIIGAIQRFLVIGRLKLHRIPYDKIVFCSYKKGEELVDKINACIDNNLDIMIEDKKANAEGIEEKTITRTYLYATRNNADIKSKRIIRFVNFGEMYSGIKRDREVEKFTLLHREEKEKMSQEELASYYKSYREFHSKYVYDSGIVRVRVKNLNRVIKYGKYVFDRIAKHRVINEERITDENGIIITINHRDMLDIPLIMRTIGVRPYHAMLKAEFLDTSAEGILTDLGCIFINRNDKSIREQARETASKRLLSGNNIIVCPEGTRNKTERQLLDFDFGAVSIAQNTGRPIMPCCIYRTANYKIVNFGTPFTIEINDDLAEANAKLYNATLTLLEECKISEEKGFQKIKKR